MAKNSTIGGAVGLDPLRWVRTHLTPEGAVMVSANNRRPYAEVTGYLIQNLLQHGALALARQFGAFLVATQLADGSFGGPDDARSYAFDTGQALRGLLALHDLEPCRNAARRAADWLCATTTHDGRLALPTDLAAWDMGARGRIPEAVHLYVLPALLQASEVLGEARYARVALRARDAYLRDREALRWVRPNMLSHFFGYVHEALIDLGAAEVAAAAYRELGARLGDDGAVPAFHDVDWVCLPGQLQAAIVLAKLGERAAAARTLTFAEAQQRDNGGFPGSVGVGAAYFPDDEPSWPVKFWLDAKALLAEPATPVLDRNLGADEWHRSICGGQTTTELAARVRDGAPPAWLPALLQATAAGERCLELGSGTGELSAHLARAGRDTLLLDFAAASLATSRALFTQLGLTGEFVQADVTGALPLPDAAVDVVWSSGLLEHFETDVIDHIVRESARVARRRVIALVPNARSVAYRVGKLAQERSGEWSWGREVPFASLRATFARAGLVDVQEHTVAVEHALQFLTAPELQPMRQALEAFYRDSDADDVAAMDQGYLLVTVGSVAATAAAAAPAPTPTPRPRRLAVLPNDPLDAYPAAGYPDLTGYFNPAGAFDEVFCLSPLEPRRKQMYGMQVIPVTAEELPLRIRELGIDVVRAYCLPAGQFACRDKVPGVRYVVSVHDPDPARCPGPLPPADEFLAVSGRIEQFLAEKGAEPARVRRLPNRVDLDAFRPIDDPVARAAWQARFPGKHRVLLVGRRSPEKNIDTLVRALALLGPDFVGICVGRGDASRYAALARELGAICHFVDAVPNRELAAWYSFADVMCTPSLYEGFGVVFIEALACGAVVVTSDIAPMNEFLRHEHDGLLVKDCRDPAALATTLRRAVEDLALRERLRQHARAAALPFDKREVDRREAELYAQPWAPQPTATSLPQPRPRPRPARATDLPAAFKLHLRDRELGTEWDRIVAGSPDAWMFHLADWQECQLAAFPLQDLSFVVEWQGRPVAVCPLQRHRHDPRVLHSTFMGTGGPAFAFDLEPEARAELQRLVHQVLRQFLGEGRGGVGADGELRLLLPQLSRTARAHWPSFVNPLVAHGFADTSTRTSLIDLTRPEPDLFAALAHGHRQPINAARKRGVRVGRLRGRRGMDDYYRLHVETYTRTGVPPHPKAYFDAIAEFMVARGHAETFAAWLDDRLVAAANIATFADGSLYWTGAYSQEGLRSGAGKLLQWEVIRAMQAAGRIWHETGEVFPDADPGSKEAGLTRYKTGFGGVLRPWFKGVQRAGQDA
ncbi:MAG: GNAT family N-acetyltransferase [Planctomycetes bacterium]|nr:GNAT family N-acetyltransferase [Planctomycetota bacterium]